MSIGYRGPLAVFVGISLFAVGATVRAGDAKATRVCVQVIVHDPAKAEPPQPAAPPAKARLPGGTASQPAATVAPAPLRMRSAAHSGTEKTQRVDSEHPLNDILRPSRKRRRGPRHRHRKRRLRHDLSMLPLGQTPPSYIKRLIEHYVTHEPGYVAVQGGCQQRLVVELYPLREGWTVFARYSKHRREEWVQQLMPDELSIFAERAVLALLKDRSINDTIMRDTVMRADTRVPKRWIGGTHHFLIMLGTELRGARIPTVQDDGTTEPQLRLRSPMSIVGGYRGKFENWGIESAFHLGVVPGKKGTRSNPAGGHVDFSVISGVSLHFLHYLDPRGVTSFFAGAGGNFQLMWFSYIRPEGFADRRGTMVTGGLDVDLVFGWEFMRASSIQWVIQGELHLPAYVARAEDKEGRLESWMPGASVRIGLLY